MIRPRVESRECEYAYAHRLPVWRGRERSEGATRRREGLSGAGPARSRIESGNIISALPMAFGLLVLLVLVKEDCHLE